MNEHFKRLLKRGYKPHEAAHILELYHKYFNKHYLELLITSMEAEGYVARVQSKSDR